MDFNRFTVASKLPDHMSIYHFPVNYVQQNGLMVACCKGFIEIVYGLNTCPYIDINHQDNEGNTALIIASQAGRSQLNSTTHPEKFVIPTMSTSPNIF